jgi:uncharacterized membrane protein
VTPQSDTILILAALAAILVVAIAGAVVYLRKRGTSSKAHEVAAPAAPPRSPPPQIETPRVGEVISVTQPMQAVKYCIHCRATMPALGTFCTKCQMTQQ